MSRPEGDTTLTAADRSGAPRLATVVPITELAAGTKVGRYVVDQRLGAGGMGVVYSARDSELARDVALKIVRPRAEAVAMEARLRREAKAMARLSHRNVVPVFDIGSHDGQLFIAVELVPGDTLRSWVTSPRPWRDVVRLFVKAGHGLDAAHTAGLLHRDFKPDNVMVGRGDEPRITDFGLARELDDGELPSSLPTDRDGELSQVTATGSLAGTPAYMAPEQLLGNQSGPGADQFSFCVALFEVLYGTRPFRPANLRTPAVLAEIRAGRVVRPTSARGVPGWLHAAITRGLAFDPEQRWPSMRALVDALERGLRRRGRWLRGLAALAAIGVAAGLVVHGRTAPPSCLDVAAKGNDAVTILVCQDEYARTNLPAVGTRLADALRHVGKLREAATVASELLATPARADALYTLGKIAADEDRPEEAERSLRLASELHRDRQQWGQSAADQQALSQISNDFVDQLVALDQAVTDARRGGDRRIEGYCHITAATILSEIGARGGAMDELARAQPLMTSPRDAQWLDLERGNVHQNLGDDALAIAAFDHARAGAETVTSARIALSARLNLVYSLTDAGRLADATAELRAAQALDPPDKKRAVRLSLEARIAARGGDLGRAARLIDQAFAATDPVQAQDLLEREVERAEIALQRDDLAAAERGARAAIARIEKLRSSHPPVEPRSWMVTDRRIPYEILFASLARRGDAQGALVVFDRYRGSSVLAGLALPDNDDGARPPGIAFPTAELARLLPSLQASALATPAPEAAIVEAVRAASVLALVVARDELWRITADAGRLHIDRLGALAALRPRLDGFRASPGDRAAATALGELLVPAELAQPSDRVLHVVLDEPLGGLAVAALRIGGRRLIAARPIVQPARVSGLGCAARPDGPPRVVVLGDDDLARRIAGVPSAPASSAVFDAARSDVLHLAVPTRGDVLGQALVLRDRPLRALEIAGHAGVAARVVLATHDPGSAGTTALAMAFLAAGADQVIAAVRPVSEAAAARFAERLYRSDVTDLARALARIQAADGDDSSLGFAAFGRASCNSQP